MAGSWMVHSRCFGNFLIATNEDLIAKKLIRDATTASAFSRQQDQS
jgi:hypothetical protein